MSAQLLAAGFSCAGPPDHSHRAWCVDAERYLLVGGETSPAMGYALKVSPVPGDAPVLIADPYRFLALLDNGGAFRLDVQHGRPKWRPIGKDSDIMKSKNDGPLITAAWPLCAGGFALLDRDRRISTWTPAGRSELVSMPVPGDARIVGVDAPSRTVVFDTGEKMSWFANSWNRLSGLLDAETAGTLRVRCERGFCLGGGVDLSPGDERDMSEIEARKLLTSGHVALVPIDENAVA